MAIHPIDVQIVLSQLDKVGKEQTALREGAAIQKAITADREARQLARNIESVNAAPEGNDPENAGKRQLEQLKGREHQGHKDKHALSSKTSPKKAGDASGEKGRPVINDPLVGKYIDIEG
jgi:hypothetical protein